ncbi:MAG: hypothetical protein ACLU7B_06775 [Bifidobacterium adolescentis]
MTHANDPSNHEQNGVHGFPGFFGSGKSHLLKMLVTRFGRGSGHGTPAQDKGNKNRTMNRERDCSRTFMGKAESQDDQMRAGQLEKTFDDSCHVDSV